MANKDVRDGRPRTPNETAWMITGRMIAGMAFYGGLGWLISLWLGHREFLIAGGLVFGLAASLYLVYIRLKNEDESPETTHPWKTKLK